MYLLVPRIESMSSVPRRVCYPLGNNGRHDVKEEICNNQQISKSRLFLYLDTYPVFL